MTSFEETFVLLLDDKSIFFKSLDLEPDSEEVEWGTFFCLKMRPSVTKTPIPAALTRRIFFHLLVVGMSLLEARVAEL